MCLLHQCRRTKTVSRRRRVTVDAAVVDSEGTIMTAVGSEVGTVEASVVGSEVASVVGIVDSEVVIEVVSWLLWRYLV